MSEKKLLEPLIKLPVISSGRAMIQPRVMDRETTEAANTEVDCSVRTQIRYCLDRVKSGAVNVLWIFM